MAAGREFSGKFDAGFLSALACPVCFGALRVGDSGLQILCVDCFRVYPLMDGIPVLIPERAVDGKILA
jgi:uncharacterized protein YbaR (Trm112 family)